MRPSCRRSRILAIFTTRACSNGMTPTSTPMRSTKRLFGQTLQTLEDIWAAAKAGRVELRPSPSRARLRARPRTRALASGEGTQESIAVVGGDGCSRQYLVLQGDPIDLGQVLRR